ncbi:bZIP transcription factor [Nitzschia inconspicua]|uniref:BZIP transcription factor n=1 Tax=Nitzschia inconspicua TaxID=303405 RepID=A0A9K3KIU6_9STRA|nr:bZIP transcription factor [Nitzschia inconspicua]
MNDFESIALFPSGAILSDVFGSAEDNSIMSDMELHDILDDIGFFGAEEESMMLPNSDIQTNITNVVGNRTSPSVLSYEGNDTRGISQDSSGTFAPTFISSRGLDMSNSANDVKKGLPATVSSSSVASKGFALKPLTQPNYYLAPNKFFGLPLAPIPVSPTLSGRPLMTAPATIALAALAAKPYVSDADGDCNTSNKRCLSDSDGQSDHWISEEDMELRRERNRVHAKKSRQRKKSLTNTLEDSLQALKEENTKLRESIYQVIGKAKTNEILEKRITDAHKGFIDCIKSNRVIDKKSITFLRSFRKKTQLANKKREQRERLQQQK